MTGALRQKRLRRARREIVPGRVAEQKPVVVWNIKGVCDLKCVHSCSHRGAMKAEDELFTHEAEAVLEDLAEFSVPSILFSGGEPLVRPDLLELIRYATDLGLRAVYLETELL